MMRRWLLAIALLALATASAHAQAWSGTLLYQGGELSDFTCVGGTTYCNFGISAGGRYRTGWARGPLVITSGGPTEPPVPRADLNQPFAGQTTLWIHAQFCDFKAGDFGPCTLATGTNARILGLFGNLGTPVVVMRGTGGSGQVKIESYNAGASAYTTLVTCPANTFPLDSLAQMDLEVVYAVAGSVHLYSNGNDVCDFTGNTMSADGSTTLVSAYFGSSQSGITADGNWSEILIATDDTRALERKTAYVTGNPVAPGVANWLPSGGCSSILPADQLDDSLYVYTSTNNAIEECSINGAIPAGLYESVVGLGVSSRTLISPGSGPQNFNWILNLGGTDYTFGASQAPVAAFNNGFNVIQTTNPATGLPWAISDFASPFSLGQKALP